MNPKEQAQLHIDLLIVMRASLVPGLPEERLLNEARMAGHELTLPALRVELRALCDKGWASEMAQIIGGPRFRITALGRSALEEMGL
jgi:hypothetical protein